MTIVEVWHLYCDTWTTDSQKKLYLEELLNEIHPDELVLFDEIFTDFPVIDEWYNYIYRKRDEVTGKQEELEIVIAEPIIIKDKEEKDMKSWDRWYNIDEQYTKKRMILENVTLHKIDEKCTELDNQSNKFYVFATQPFLKEGVKMKVKNETVEAGQKEIIRQGYDCVIHYKERKEAPTEVKPVETPKVDDNMLDVDDIVLDDEELILPQ